MLAIRLSWQGMNTALRRLSLVIVTIGLVAAWIFADSARAERGWMPSREHVAALEARLALPAGAKPLGSYARYYAGIHEDQRRKIFGYLVLDAHYDFVEPGEPGTVHIISIDDMPILHGGRCGVVGILFDVEAQAFDRTWCNGDR